MSAGQYPSQQYSQYGGAYQQQYPVGAQNMPPQYPYPQGTPGGQQMQQSQYAPYRQPVAAGQQYGAPMQNQAYSQAGYMPSAQVSMPGAYMPAAQYGARSMFSAQNAYALLKPLSGKIRTLGVCWLIIGIIQLLVILAYLEGYIYLNISEEYVIIYAIIAVINTVSSIIDLSFASKMMTAPVNIIKRYKPPVAALIFNAIYNALWAILPALLIIINFSIRRYIVENEQALSELEQNYLNTHSQ